MTTTDNDNDNDKNSNNDDNTLNPLSRWGLPEPLLLGSASFTRKSILKEMGVPYRKFVRPINEKALGDRSGTQTPQELVLLLAHAKMDRLIQELSENDNNNNKISHHDNDDDNNNKKQQQPETEPKPDTEYVILTGDQVIMCGGKILEKPESVEEAKDFVTMYATTPPSTIGSCVLYHHPSGLRVAGTDTATIHFNSTTLGRRDAPSTLIDTLLAQGQPVMSCAGGLMIEHPLVQHYVQDIDGTKDSVMGLSKNLVLRLLEDLHSKLTNKQQQQQPK